MARGCRRGKPALDAEPSDDFDRMVAWARNRLAILEATVAREHISQDLTNKSLFPEVDELYDPEGDPPSEARLS
jgi:hypothetical protein